MTSVSSVLVPYNKTQQFRWQMIVNTLQTLAAKCHLFLTQGQQVAEASYGHPRNWLPNAICEYNENAKKDCNFQVILKDDELVFRMVHVLPLIIGSALSLPQWVNKPLEFLKMGENKTVPLDRKHICSLLAHGFLSTFPKQKDGDSMEMTYFNFWRLFHHKVDSKTEVKREKIKCLLEYFEQMGSPGSNIPTTEVSFERRSIKRTQNWKLSSEKLYIICVIADGTKIENAKDMLQVDFANRYIGGGVLADGAVQEEIRFLICPELLVSRLFTEKLDDKEVVIITGPIQFSDYTGYGPTFKFKKLKPELDAEGNRLPRREAQVVAMDAKYFVQNKSREQYRKVNIDRELHKSYVGFSPGNQSCRIPIATGNWGCGAFHGDPELKFIIQWMAASQNKRSVQYYARNEGQKKEFEFIARHLVSRKVTVGQLYQVLIRYDADVLSKILPGSRELPKTVLRFLFDNLK